MNINKLTRNVYTLLDVNTIGWSREGLSDNLVPRASPWPLPFP